jgi:hypothetical protein
MGPRIGSTRPRSACARWIQVQTRARGSRQRGEGKSVLERRPAIPHPIGIVHSNLPMAGVIPAEPIALPLCERVWSGENVYGSAGL